MHNQRKLLIYFTIDTASGYPLAGPLGGLETLELALSSGVGALQPALRLPETVEETEVLGGWLSKEGYFAGFHARQFPLGDGHSLEIEAFGPGLWLPFGFQIAVKLMQILGVFARQDDGAGAKAMTQGVQADDGLSLGSSGARRL
jgi:hypothetical protein